jgi:hypothetical protein
MSWERKSLPPIFTKSISTIGLRQTILAGSWSTTTFDSRLAHRHQVNRNLLFSTLDKVFADDNQKKRRDP